MRIRLLALRGTGPRFEAAPPGKIPAVLALSLVAGVLAAVFLGPMIRPGTAAAPRKKITPQATPAKPTHVVLGFNDLGMHCMNQYSADFNLLPPFNNLHAQVIDRSGEEPKIVKSGVQVQYSIPGNTFSVGKTDFWTYAQKLFGLKAPLPPNVGLTGNGLSGVMKPTATGDFEATGIPITPLTDAGVEDAYQLSLIKVIKNGATVATTRAVVPVSWEISCNLCHNGRGLSVTDDILTSHDRRHGTRLMASKPVLCGSCHADPALGTPGVSGVKALSHAMHGAHASRMAPVQGMMAENCYSCHPGVRTQCQRDIHYAKGITCTQCHGDMAAVGNTARRPWVDEPKCGSCHKRAGFEFEEPGKLFKESRGHHGVKCASCHGSPHAITPTVTAPDNVQAIALQGFPGVIKDCTVCHKTKPKDRFEHKRDD